MSVRRDADARAPPAAARPGTLCGPAITLATSGSYGHAATQTESKLPRSGTIVKVDNVNYAVQCDRHSKLWWYPNVHVLGAKLYVKGSAKPYKAVEITSGQYDYVLKGNFEVWDAHILEYEVGTRVQFVPYERSELKFEDHYLIIVDEGREKDTHMRPMPYDCAGVATQVRRLG